MGKKIIIKYQGTPIGSWMVTFSDMNTLLLTFFVLLFSMSTIATDDFDEIFQPTVGDSLSLMSEGSMAYSSGMRFDPTPMIPKTAVMSALDIFRVQDERAERDIGIPAGVEFELTDAPDGAIAIVLADSLLYGPGETELTEESRIFLDKVGIFLQRILSMNPRRIAIEGHTDNSTPIDEGFRISASRAEEVLGYLLQNEALPPQLFSVVGYGAFKPVVENNSDFNRAKNRRVRIVVEPLEVPNEDFYF